MKRAGKLFDTLISDDNLLRAIDEVNRTHHWNRGHKPNTCTAWVEETKPQRVEDLRRILVGGFEPKPPHVSQRWDTSARKWRTISEPAQWPDQYVHHALIQALQPKMMQGMDFYCCGSIRGRGTEREKKAIERWLKYDRKGTKYEFCGDIRHFYESLTPEVVMARMRQLYKDRRVLDLIERIIRNGIQLGTYTSQWLANAVLQPLDRLIRESGYCRHYARYMDNMTAFGPNRRKLKKLRLLVEGWLDAHDLQLKGDWQVFPVAKPQRKEPLLPPRQGFARAKGRLPDRCRLPVRERLHHPPQAESAAHQAGAGTVSQAQAAGEAHRTQSGGKPALAPRAAPALQQLSPLSMVVSGRAGRPRPEARRPRASEKGEPDMDYVFGTKGGAEVLKTIGGAHTSLTGYHQLEREYPDQTITDSFRVVRKLRSAEDAEGRCYDWYEIDHHYRMTDKTGPLAERTAKAATELQDAVCELDMASQEHLTTIETALCELDAALNKE